MSSTGQYIVEVENTASQYTVEIENTSDQFAVEIINQQPIYIVEVLIIVIEGAIENGSLPYSLPFYLKNT